MTRDYSASSRMRKARRRNRRGFISSFFQLLFLLALMGVIGYAVYKHVHQGQEYTVRTVRVEGTHVLSPEEVVAQSGITDGDNFFKLDVEGVKKQVESLARVKSCFIEQEFPDTIVLYIEERVPVATLLVDNRLFEIDDECVALRELGLMENPDHVFISNVANLGFIELGQKLDMPELHAALAVLKSFAATEMSKDVTISEVTAQHVNDIRLYCNELPFEIRWGHGDFEDEARRLDILWREKKGQLECQEYLDLRFGNDLACK